MTTGPDGTIYIADMYRGIIEGAEWAKEGHVSSREDQAVPAGQGQHGHGRVWRLTYDGIARDRTQPRMLNETPAQLVAHLSHPNGWWRDTAQQLLVLKQDKSVVPALQSMVRTSKNQLARFHALWTLEGLDALTAGARRARCSAIRNPACGSRRCAPARRSTRLATDRSPATIARSRRTRTPTS